jgi:UDP-glucose 4-epimerase/UDP-glucuronate decarboxylase
MTHLLLAGGSGFLGSHLADRLLRRKDVRTLTIVDNLWTGRSENLRHIHDPRLKFVQADSEAFRTETKFDEIYNLASPASPPWYGRAGANDLGQRRRIAQPARS